MRVTFVYPDAESVGVQSLMAVLEKEGHEVDFVFYFVEDFYTNYKNKGLDYSILAKRIQERRPHVVAFSAVTDIFRYQVQVAHELKKISGALTIFGGIHPTLLPKETLALPEVDAVAVGEAEVSFPKWLNSLKVEGDKAAPPAAAVKGIAHKHNGSVVGDYSRGDLPELDDLPFLKKEPFMPYLPETREEYLTMTSRGCPYACSYCTYSYLNEAGKKRMIRQRKVDNVIAELKYAKEKLGMKYVLFADDCFTTNTSWLEEFTVRYKAEVDLPFQCITSPFQLSERKVDLLKMAGCVNTQMGIQSLSEDLCKDVLERKSNNKKIAEAIGLLKSRGIMVRVDCILGIPEDTLENQERALEFFSEHKPEGISVFWLKYYPKIKITGYAVASGILTKEEAEKADNPSADGETAPSFYYGGNVGKQTSFNAVAFMLNWLPHTPRFVAKALIRSKLYRLFSTQNFYLSIALPRLITCSIDDRDFRARAHVRRFFSRIIGKIFPFGGWARAGARLAD